jgi:hypothetical protein
MRPILTLISIFLAAAVSTLPGMSQAQAQNNLSYVSAGGNDGNSCSTVGTACRSFTGALNKTNDSGIISCVDAGNFVFTIITQSVTIDCLAGGGGINAQTFLINAPGKTVRLRNLALNGLNTGAAPISIVAAKNVYIENVVVAENTGGAPGISDTRAGPAMLVIKNSSVVNASGVGILVAPTGGSIGVELENVTSAYNKYGLAVGSGGRVMIRDSFFMNNSVAGIEGDAGAVIAVHSSQVAFNSTGIASPGTVTLANSSINSNTTAISGPTQSLGNNVISANSAKGTAPTIVSGE